MALFGENREQGAPRPAGASGAQQINMVGAGTVFEGTFRTEGDVSVSGRIEGELHVSGRAVITQEGVVDGTLHAAEADVSGRVEGDLTVAERLVLRSTARVEGRLRAGRLVVEEGAVFDGECRMGREGKLVARTDGPHEAVLPDRAPSKPAKEGGPRAAAGA
ncbi:MAG: polymer-forming cytoskeletal protein [Rhodothermales bacterium]|nr:polymer-forming cytoskeletal protein [Rhodothermales bacterium]